MNQHQSPALSIRWIWELVVRHKKKIVICPLLALGLGVLILLFCPRTYRSEAKLFLRVGRESVALDPTATTGQTISLLQGDRKDEVKSAIEVLKSRGVIAKAVDEIGPAVVLGEVGVGVVKPSALAAMIEKPLRAMVDTFKSIDPVSEREEAIIEVERNLNVDAERESTLIVVQYDADTPLLAQVVCEAIVAVYQREHMRIHRNEESQPFFTEQQQKLRQQLDDALTAIRAAKNGMSLSSVDGRRNTLESQFSAVELEKFSTQQQLVTAQARIGELERQLATLPERLLASKRSVPNVGADLLRDQLYQLELKSADLQARYSDEHPLVQAIQAQLEEAERVVDAQSEERTETTDDVNPIHRKLSLELKQQRSLAAGLAARIVELEDQKKSVVRDLRQVNDYDLKLDQLQRDADMARSNYLAYTRSLEESRIDKELENLGSSNVSIAQPATLAEKPVSPSRLLVCLATFMLATAGTASLVLASEQMSDQPRGGAHAGQAPAAPMLGSVNGERGFGRAATNGHSVTTEPQVALN